MCEAGDRADARSSPGESVTADTALLALIEHIYDAASDERLWPSVMEQVAAVMESHAVTFSLLRDAEKPRFSAFAALEYDPRMHAGYVESRTLADSALHFLTAHPQPASGHELQSPGERDPRRHASYDWHWRYSATWHHLAGMTSPAPGFQSGIILHRGRERGDYNSTLTGRFAVILRHIERALEIGFRLGSLAHLERATMELLDRNPQAVFLFDDHGHFTVGNRAAEELIAGADGVGIDDCRLTLHRRPDNNRLQDLIASVLSNELDPTTTRGGLLAAPRPSGKRSYSLLVSPLAPLAFSLGAPRFAGCVVIADPELRPLASDQHLGALYGLTAAEARLAVRIVAGETLRAAATQLGITYATARTTLACIFRKTGTRRQSELVAMILGALPLLTPTATDTGGVNMPPHSGITSP